MVFVRVHLIRGRLSAAQKDELGAKLIQAISDVEGLADNPKNKEVSWVGAVLRVRTRELVCPCQY